MLEEDTVWRGLKCDVEVQSGVVDMSRVSSYAQCTSVLFSRLLNLFVMCRDARCKVMKRKELYVFCSNTTRNIVESATNGARRESKGTTSGYDQGDDAQDLVVLRVIIFSLRVQYDPGDPLGSCSTHSPLDPLLVSFNDSEPRTQLHIESSPEGKEDLILSCRRSCRITARHSSCSKL